MSDKVNSVPKKLLAARGIIKSTKIKRDGSNKFSNYDYFTPDQVSNLVNDACQEVGLLTVFSLNKDEVGYFGELVTIDVETGDTVTSIMRTEIPEIKATNATQKMGGAYTYTKRYMLMNEFDIADNNLDFDAQDNRPARKHSGDSDRDANTSSFLAKKKFIPVNKPEVVEPEAVEPEAVKPEAEAVDSQPIEPKETSELELLQAKCDRLGITYTARHKESGLQKLIDEFNADDVEPEVIAINKDDDDETEIMVDFLMKVDAYTVKSELAADANGIVKSAIAMGVSAENAEELKQAVNRKYQSM